MEVKHYKPSELKPYERNNRKHPPEQIEKLAKQIAAHGWDVPIVADKDLVIIKGHARLKAAKKLKLKTVPVIVRDDLTPEQCAAARLADNKLGELAEIDMEAIQAELDALKAIDFDLDLTAFDSWSPFAVESEEGTEGLTDPDEVPELKPDPKSKLGDVWILGDHRVMCGDSTDAASVAILMNGKKADMLFTDPPYGVDYEGGHFHSGNVNIKRKREKLASDNDASIYTKVIPVICQFVDGPCYTWYAASKATPLYQGIDDHGEFHAMIVWHKINATYAAMNAQYKQRHEPCAYWKPKGCTLRWCGASTEAAVWEEKRDAQNKFHPTQKPTILAEKAINNHEAKSVLDLFLGSGSTLIACEKTGRTCYGMELSPQYVDVILKRWQDFTGKKAIREDGIEFDSL